MEPPTTLSEDLANEILDGQYRRIIILSGAGCSTSAGIPDYRSLNGKFTTFNMAIFSDRTAYMATKSKFAESFIGALPTSAHRLAIFLHKRGFLRRVYTQNIDGLYQAAGLPGDMLVEAHGNLADDSVVLYDERLPFRFDEMVVADFLRCEDPPDLLLAMGTTLQVAPFCALANFVPKSCTRALITLNIHEAMNNSYGKMPGPQFVRFAKHRVSLKGQWSRKFRRRWPRQYLLNENVEAWSKRLLDAPKQP